MVHFDGPVSRQKAPPLRKTNGVALGGIPPGQPSDTRSTIGILQFPQTSSSELKWLP